MRLPRTGRSPAIDENVVFGNTAFGGGGVRLCFFDGTIDEPTFQENTIFDNHAYEDGGGVQVYEADPVIASCTIDGNSAGTLGGGIYAGRRSVGPMLTTTITNTIVANSESGGGVAADLAPIVTSLCDVWNNTGGNYVNCAPALNDMSLDPLYCDPLGHDFTLRDDSPCLPENNAWGALIGAHGAGGCGTSVTSSSGVEPAFRLHRPFPSPSSGPFTLSYSLNDAVASVDLDILSVGGRVVRRFEGLPGAPGDHEIPWDGTNREGQPVASGVYIVRGSTGTSPEYQGIVVLRRR